ncbi:diguanylate cyclase domain-containing protein [Cryptosporangium sp. NPDC048952]|uniref:diguanylate cyclase domain-containing protein n=1 Tax=Cryptosporangium sp. NPDC048952 TaxID=3363961 RepID=UPI003718F32B
MLARLRTIFLLYALFTASVGIASTLNAPYGSYTSRVAAALAVVVLMAYWLIGWSRQQFPAWLEPVEWMLVAAPCLVVDAVSDNGGYFGALLFRSYYGTRRQFWIRLALVQIVPATRLVVGVVEDRPMPPPQYVAVVLFGLLVPPLVRALRGVAEQNSRLIARERTHLTGSEQLAAAADHQALYDAAVAVAVDLTAAPRTAGVLLALSDAEPGTPGSLRFAAERGMPDGLVGAAVALDRVPPEIVARMTGSHPDYLTPDDYARLRDATGLPPSPGGLLVVPISAGGRYRGAFGISGAGRLPVDTQTSLATWGMRVAEALHRIDLTAELTFRAYHDPLTTLANRALLESRLEHALGDRRAAGQVALLLLDLDGFKQVNDVHGHPAGDELLRTIAGRLQRCVRETDTVARIGGDEFAILLNGVDAPELVAATADRVVDTIREPIQVEGRTVTVGVSVGVAVAQPGGPVGVRELIRAGDQAMYRRKATRAGGWERYELTV